MKVKEKDLVIVGFGPAGLATSIAARDAGFTRIQTIDPTPNIGGGGLSQFGIESNSSGNDFVSEFEPFPPALDLPEAQPLRGNNGPVQLTFASRFLHGVAKCLVQNKLVDHCPEPATALHQTPNGFKVSTPTQEFIAQKVVVAPGGKERLLPEFATRKRHLVFTSEEVLSKRRIRELARDISKRANVAIIGNAHGAYSCAVQILEQFPQASIDIYKKSPTKPYFESVDDATRHGYELTARDAICPESGRINRFDGIRGKARELWLRETLGNEPRVRSHLNIPFTEIADDVPVIQAIGYEPRKINFVHEDGTRDEYQEIPGDGGYATLHFGNVPLKGAYSLGIGHGSKRDGANVYHAQARLLLSQGL